MTLPGVETLSVLELSRLIFTTETQSHFRRDRCETFVSFVILN
jgi:hypothetical protein